MSGRVHNGQLSVVPDPTNGEKRHSTLLEWRDLFPLRLLSLFNRVHAFTPSLTQVGKHIMGHSRNKIAQIINESGYLKKQNLITGCSSLRVSSGPIQIRSMLKHLIDFSTLAHNLLLTDLEFFGFWPLRSELIIWAHQPENLLQVWA